MLSASYTIADVQARLENDYSFYGYASPADFVTSLRNIADDVYRLYFIPKIGINEYATIAAKNRASLTELETNLYWAEVFTICFEFLKTRSAVRDQLQNSGDETLTVEGYTHRIGGSGGSVSKGDYSIKRYRDQMYQYWMLSGYNISSMERTCTIFGDGLLFGRTIIQ